VAVVRAFPSLVWSTRSHGRFVFGALSGRPDLQTIQLPPERCGGGTAVAPSRRRAKQVRSGWRPLRHEPLPVGREHPLGVSSRGVSDPGRVLAMHLTRPAASNAYRCIPWFA
jgi:hypothetical protein